MDKILISIVGPTAIGKTALSIQLAQNFNTEILSADSRQFYKEMSIGTAAPTPEELAAAPHHFVHHISVEDEYSVGDFERDALNKAEKLFEKNNPLILVGGSGLYVKSLLEGLDHFPEVNPEIRLELNDQLRQNGISGLQEQLQLVDPNYYKVVDTDNPHRIIRALEISLGTGKPYSTFLAGAKSPRSFSTIKIGLTAPREIIYKRINQRVEKMIETGLLEEAEQLFPLRTLNALNTVGYKELFTYLEGHLNFPEAVEKIKKNTRRFAKRQLTWFRKEKDITWFEYTTPVEEILSYLKTQISDEKLTE